MKVLILDIFNYEEGSRDVHYGTSVYKDHTAMLAVLKSDWDNERAFDRQFETDPAETAETAETDESAVEMKTEFLNWFTKQDWREPEDEELQKHGGFNWFNEWTGETYEIERASVHE